MKPIDIILITAIAFIVVSIVAYIVRKKRKGEKIGCGCACQSCPQANACGGAKDADERTEKARDCAKTQREDTDNE